MIALIIILAVLVLLLVGLVVGGYIGYIRTFYNKGTTSTTKIYKGSDPARVKHEQDLACLMKENATFPFEEIYITAHDKVKLYARYYHIKDGAPVFILMHGYKSTADRDMSGFFKIARDTQNNILLVDQRGCGKSQNADLTFGIKERYDALSWVNYINERFGCPPVFLCGVSLGGSSVLMASELDLPKNVMGIMSDCAFSSPTDIIKKVCRDNKYPPLIYPFIKLGAVLFGHFSIGGKGAFLAVKSACVPILIIHGKGDNFVPYSMAEKIYENISSEKTLFPIDSPVHAGCYTENPQGYRDAVRSFVEKCLLNAK